MKQAFIPKKFGADALALLDKITTVLDTYSAQGYDLSLRQLYYQLVAANVVPNTERSYKNIGVLVSDARLAGLIDWDIIKDRGREMTQNNHWDAPRQILEACAAQFQVDKWADQPCYVEVMVEKQALEGVLEPVCNELDVPFTANKGYSSQSAMYEAAKRMYQRIRDDKEVNVIYLGDHDPSGMDMTRDVQERLRLFTHYTEGDQICVNVHRVALNMDQIGRLNPPQNPAKLTDSRADAYVREFGNSSWELDAIKPNDLATLVRNAVAQFRDDSIWKKSMSRQNKMRAELNSFAKNSKFNP